MKKSKVLKTALIGGLVGGVVAWMMTTERGREVRDRLQSSLLDEADRFLGTIEDKLERWGQEAVAQEEEQA
jgi:gas vesicle protein